VKTILCFFFGRRYTQVDWDWYACDRCGETNDGYAKLDTLPTIVRHWQEITEDWANYRSRLFQRCPDCRRPEYILGRPVGDHADCIPF
jgi:hypothetical protein